MTLSIMKLTDKKVIDKRTYKNTFYKFYHMRYLFKGNQSQILLTTQK